MLHRFTASAATMLCLFLCAPSAAKAPLVPFYHRVANSVTSELPVPPDVFSRDGLAHVLLTAAIDPMTQLPAFYYAGQTVAPTIHIWPGDTLVVDYTNALPAETSAPLDITNLHTHGLMDSPKQPGDQVIMTMILPGQTYRYVYHIPENQPPGLYWYHPHPHGESNRQVASGMSGLIVVGGIEDYAPIVRGLPERDILLRDYYFDPSTAPLTRNRQRAVMHEVSRERAANPALDLRATIRAVVARAASLPPVPANCDPSSASKGFTINGVPAATITMAPGSRQFFRIANTSANSFYDLQIPGSRLLVVANDGVPLSFHDTTAQGQWVDHVLVPPAGRTEVVVEAPSVSGTPLQSACVDYGPDGDVGPLRNLATIVLGTPPALHRMAVRALARRPEPFGNIHRWHVAAQRVVNFTEDNPDSRFFINGQLWDPNAPPMFVAHVGTVEQWTVYNYARELHALHIHQIHFLVQDINGVDQPLSAWRDTITLPYAQIVNGNTVPGVVHLLMDFRDPIIAGTFVFHCHILEHEDYGMMAKIQVIGNEESRRAVRTSYRGFHEGLLAETNSARRLREICKRLQRPGMHLCGCDTPKLKGQPAAPATI